MTQEHNTIETPLIQAIKSVGSGRKSSKPCPDEIIEHVVEQIESGSYNDAVLGAFFSALFFKGIEASEKKLVAALGEGSLDSAKALVHALFPKSTPTNIVDYAVFMLEDNVVSQEQATEIGRYILTKKTPAVIKGFFASLFRVKYETHEEFLGLLRAMEERCDDAFNTLRTASKPLIQLAEPFDGFARSLMVTPLLANDLQSKGYAVVSVNGRSSGPKFGLTNQDVMRKLEAKALSHTTELTDESTPYGYALEQQTISPILDSWVDIRRAIVKRPFMATLEKLINPFNAEIGFFSAFHAPYAEKMVNLALDNGFKAAVSLFKSMEGSLGMALGRDVQIVCGVRKQDGTTEQERLVFNPHDFDLPTYEEHKCGLINVAENVRLINAYNTHGTSGDEYFDARVKLTNAVYEKALEWITQRIEL